MQSNNLREKMFALCREWEDSGKKRSDRPLGLQNKG